MSPLEPTRAVLVFILVWCLYVAALYACVFGAAVLVAVLDALS